MAKREFLMLAHNYEFNKQSICMWYMSEKCDGLRALWDGGVSRGIPCDEVPFANVEKDSRLIRRPIATGLWSRYGKVIHAPGWWLDKLPAIPLDGELYAGRGNFQTLTSIAKQHVPGSGWDRVRYVVFDAPPLEVVLSDGEIDNANFRKKLKGVIGQLPLERLTTPRPSRREFESVYSFISRRLEQNDVFQVHPQEQLPVTTAAALERLEERLLEVTMAGGEGLILRAPMSVWTPERMHQTLKVKRLQDAEGIVTGYVWGKETSKGSKLLGMMGALVLNFNGQRLEISGFTEQEREMALECHTTATDGLPWREHYAAAARIGELHPGENVQPNIFNPRFPRGSKVSFKYRELSDASIPKEARYFRKA